MNWLGRLFSWGADKEEPPRRTDVGPGARPLPPGRPNPVVPRNAPGGPGQPGWRQTPRAPSGRSVPYSPGGNRGGASQGNAPSGVRAASAPSPVRSLYDPAQASRGTQRILRGLGWTGEQLPLGEAPGWRMEGAREEFAPHSFKLPDWQVEQIEQDYGYRAPEGGLRKQTGERYGLGTLQLEDYETLSDRQKQALDFNRLLVDAVQRDRALGAPATGDDMAEYQSRVQEMFGTQGGSEMYAPNTMALLEGLEMGRLRNQDLDEYLSLDRAFTDQEVAALQQWDEVPKLVQKGYAASRTAENSAVLDMMQIDSAGRAIEAALAQGNADSYSWDDQSRIAKQLGYQLDPAATPIGWLVGMDRDEVIRLRGGEQSDDAVKELMFQDLYNVLQSRATETPDDFWFITEDLQFTDQDYEEIFDYFYLRSLEDDRTGIITDPQYRSGQELRDFIGIG